MHALLYFFYSCKIEKTNLTLFDFNKNTTYKINRVYIYITSNVILISLLDIQRLYKEEIELWRKLNNEDKIGVVIVFNFIPLL